MFEPCPDVHATLMAQKRETERKYEAPSARDGSWLPDLTGVGGVESVLDQGTDELDAVYYDTDDLRIARASATLRRRTGGADAGWHLKLPLSGDSREEVEEPLSDTLPDTLRELVLSRTRGADVRPVVRVRSTRRTRHLVGHEGDVLAELSVDTVRADPLPTGDTSASWTEMEIELAEDSDPALLDTLEKTLRAHSISRADHRSKLARALEETGAGTQPQPETDAKAGETGTAGEELLRYVDEQVSTLVELDPSVRRDLPDAVHQMRVTCRRLRSILRSYRPVLAREVTDPVRAELKWLGAELGAERDQEVLRERLGSHIRTSPTELVLGPVEARLRVWDVARTAEARQRTLDALRSPRYLALLDSVATLVQRPPLRRKAERAPEKVMTKAILKEYERLAARVTHAMEIPPGTERDTALHRARKAAKRTRYATEPARSALGKPAKRFGKRVKAVQKVLGEHQDSVVARDTLHQLAVAAQTAGEAGFTWGLLYGQERALAEQRERELPTVWAEASKSGMRKALAH